MKKHSRFAAAVAIALLLVAQSAFAQADPGMGLESWGGILRNAACGLAVGLAATWVFGIGAAIACLLTFIDP